MAYALQAERTRPPLDILLVEDDASDRMLAEISLEAAEVDCILHRLENGADVLSYLRRTGPFSKVGRPDMVLLDLSLPYKDGFEVLSELAQQAERFRDIPIVILTGDQHSAFLKQSTELNIAGYLTKPCSAKKMKQAMALAGKRRQ